MKIVRKIVIAVLVFFSLPGFACEKVVAGYESKDLMYVVCPSLEGLSSVEASALVANVMSQYIGPPDEVLVYFVVSSELVGKPERDMSDSELVGVYYTHESKLFIWPNSKSRKNTIELSQ